MSEKLRYHLKKAELYGLLMKKYEYVDPALHVRFYRKHFYHTQCVDRLYWESKHKGAGFGPGWESSGAHGSGWSGGNPGAGWSGMSSPGAGWPGGSPGADWSGMGSPGAGWPGMGGAGGVWPGMGSPGAGWPGMRSEAGSPVEE